MVERLSDADPMAAACARLNIQLAETAIERDQLKSKAADYERELAEVNRVLGDTVGRAERLRADNEALRGRLAEAERLTEEVCRQRDALMGRLNAAEKRLADQELRPKVLAFAMLMEEKLRQNDHKGGWEWDHPNALLTRLYEVADELRAIVKRRKDGGLERGIAKEAADVANFAMMVADVCGGLETP